MNHLLDLPRTLLVKLPHYDLMYQLDLGDNHWLSFTRWDPDLDLNPKYKPYESVIKANLVCGAIVIHKCQTPSGYHEGSISFKTPSTALWPTEHANHTWVVHSWEPLDLSPSLLSHCPCKDHGFIKQGRWQRA